MKYIIYPFIALMFFSLQNKAEAQCCAAGNPVSSNYSMQDNGKNVLSVSLSHIYSVSDTYYNGIEALDKKYINTDFNFTSLSLSYGLSAKLRALAEIGYFFNKSQNFVNQDYSRYAQGFGDLNLGISYDSYQNEDAAFTIKQTFKVTLPVGNFNQIYDGIELPIDLQPSSGNYKYNMGVALSKSFGLSGFSLYSINSIELAQFVETSTSKYKYGNLYNLSIIGGYSILDNLTGLLQLRAEIRDKALNASLSQPNQYSYINATGLFNIFVSPQLSYTIPNALTLSCQFNYPIYKNVNGEQLTNKYSIQAGISKSFNLSKDEELSEDIEESKDLAIDGNHSSQVHVSGNCGMCKARIEGVVNEFKNVENSKWDSETDLLTIYFKEDKPDITVILKAVAAVGHDNELFKADDAVYNKLHSCCLYRK